MKLMSTRPRGVVRVTGADAASYLNGQISQDIEAIPVGDAAWSLVLDPSGKLVAWFRVHRLDENEFVLDCEPGVVDALIARLERFKLRTDATFDIESAWQMTRHRSDDPVVLSDRNGDLASEFAWPGFHCTDFLAKVAEPVVNVNDGFEEARIRAAVPSTGTDIDEDTIPAEGGQPLIDMSVSFTTGCYTGQELVARINSRGGNVPRPLRVMEADEPLAVGAAVVYDGQEIGAVTSAAGNVAMGRIQRKAEVGSEVQVGGVVARVIVPSGES
jgi:folate-binding protein YgfZ